MHAGIGCDAVIIPHNSNLSAGRQFFVPADGAEMATAAGKRVTSLLKRELSAKDFTEMLSTMEIVFGNVKVGAKSGGTP